MKSEQAQVASIMKKFVKSMGLEVSTKSSSYSGGDSVRVKVKNANPAQIAAIETESWRYKMGSFNGMEDIYEYHKTEAGIPTTKYIFVDFDWDQDCYQAAYSYARDHIEGGENLPELYSDVTWDHKIHGRPAHGMVRQYLSGSEKVFHGGELVTIWEACQFFKEKVEVSKFIKGAMKTSAAVKAAKQEQKGKFSAIQGELVEYVTKRGKTLRGVIFHGTKEQAQAIDEYTFKLLGGWFIREKHLSELEKAA
jgi:hypothetical protein